MKPPKRLFKTREGEPGPAKDPIRFACGASLVACRELKGMTDHDELRREVLGYAKQALEGEDDAAKTTTMVIEGREEVMVNCCGVFRLMFSHMGIDRRDLRMQEAIFARIDRTITKILAPNW